MVSAVISTVQSWVTSFATMFVSIFESLVGIFYKAGESGGAGSLTLVGTLALAGLGIGLVYFAYRVIRNLMRLR